MELQTCERSEPTHIHVPRPSHVRAARMQAIDTDPIVDVACDRGPHGQNDDA